MNNLPSGTVTFLFTDIESSTKLRERHPEAMKAVLAKHDSVLKDAIESNHGRVIKTTGDGVHAVFTTALDAINAALSSQRNLQLLITNLSVKVRMGLHTGEAELRDGDYYGGTLNRVARIMSAGHGGQILISDVVAQVVRENLTADVTLSDLGEHHLKGLLRAEKIYQVVAPDLQKEFPPLNSIPTSTNNLPSQLTSFIGREREMKEASAKLTSAKLLTLIGPGGTGKTRLSIQIASERLVHFKDGAWLVELAPISDPAFIIPAIAAVFEIREVQNIPLIQIVLDYLRAKELLLVLDNCEHLVEASAQLANQLLHECPSLKIVASSREALGVDGETVYRVPSLKDDEAVRLFVERATKAEPRFQLTDDNASFVAQICSRLDGIPLAIELAAARVKIFSPKQIAERLDNRFKLLTGGSRTALPRQQTLRALIDWSYASLNETEQRALRRLAVFSGGWTFEAAESILGESEAIDALGSLVNKSLVNVEEQESKSRFRFLETIRQYAMEKLAESGEAVEARDRLFEYVLELAQGSGLKMFGEESVTWLDQMEVEHDNLRAALEWAIANYPDQALRLADALGGFWTSRDYNHEARTMCKTMLAQTESLENLDSERAKVFALLGWTSITTGNHKEGRAAAEAGITLARKSNDRRSLARCLGVLSLASTFLGDFPTALQAAAEGEALTREGGFAGELALMLTIRAQTTYFTLQDAVLAKTYLDEAIALGTDSGFRWVNSMSAFGMARVAAVMDDLKTARIKFAESAEYARLIGNKRLVYSSQSELAHILREHGELDEPLATYRDLLPKWADLGHRAAVAHELECIAYILIKKEEPERAANLFGSAEALRKLIDSIMTKVEQIEYKKEVSTLREMLGEDSMRKKWDEGKSLTMEQAIELAVSLDKK